MRKRAVAILITLVIAATGAGIGAKTFEDQVKNRSLYTGRHDPDSYTQQKERFQTLVYEEGTAEALTKLENESLNDPRTLALCHDLLHGIGSASYEKTLSVSESLTINSSFCNSGYIHGVFESYFKHEQPNKEDLALLCDQFLQETSFKVWQCLHGMGHGFMYLTDGDLDTSLELCSKTLSENNKVACHNGAFMEVFNAEILPKEQNFVDQENPFAVCHNREPKNICYAYVPVFLSQTNDLAFSDIFLECKKAGKEYEAICIHGVGSEAMKRNMDDPSAIFELCSYAGSFSKAEECIRGTVSMYLNQKGSYEEGEFLCAEAPLFYRHICNAQVKNKELFFREI